MDLARRHGLRVIEDAAQAIGSEYAGVRAGAFGDVGCFSFFPSKNLGAFGDAGLCTAQDEELAERLRVMRVHGGKPKYNHAVLGGNTPAMSTAPRSGIEGSSRAWITFTAPGSTASSHRLPVSVMRVNCGTNSRGLPVRFTTR